jgi:poly [ADP-ribose] polymerase
MAAAKKKKIKLVVNNSFSWKVSYKTSHRQVLNFTDIVNNNNKFYNIEIQFTDTQFVIYTEYGRVGGTKQCEYRECSSFEDAVLGLEQIVGEKKKKGYLPIKLATALEDKKVLASSASALPGTIQTIVTKWFAAANDFIDQNLDKQKCPLGSLSDEQLRKGYEYVESLRKLVGTDSAEIIKISNSYYTNIPHNFGYGKIDTAKLTLDTHAKLDFAIDFLDVLSSTKSDGGVFATSDLDKKYKLLNSDIEFIEHDSVTFGWVKDMLHKTRASNHGGLGKIEVRNVYKLKRNLEEPNFVKTLADISSQKVKALYSSTSESLLKNRPDLTKDEKDIYVKGNVWAAWHGTRRANIVGILRNGFLIRPSGVVHAGSVYGDGIYFATNSTKSLNYVDVAGSYWARGSAKVGWMFLCDVILGNQKIVSSGGNYTLSNIKPYHSVWAPAGRGGVINDEMIVYNTTGVNQQHAIRYVVEVETQL